MQKDISRDCIYQHNIHTKFSKYGDIHQAALEG